MARVNLAQFAQCCVVIKENGRGPWEGWKYFPVILKHREQISICMLCLSHAVLLLECAKQKVNTWGKRERSSGTHAITVETGRGMSGI